MWGEEGFPIRAQQPERDCYINREMDQGVGVLIDCSVLFLRTSQQLAIAQKLIIASWPLLQIQITFAPQFRSRASQICASDHLHELIGRMPHA